MLGLGVWCQVFQRLYPSKEHRPWILLNSLWAEPWDSNFLWSTDHAQIVTTSHFTDHWHISSTAYLCGFWTTPSNLPWTPSALFVWQDGAAAQSSLRQQSFLHRILVLPRLQLDSRVFCSLCWHIIEYLQNSVSISVHHSDYSIFWWHHCIIGAYFHPCLLCRARHKTQLRFVFRQRAKCRSSLGILEFRLLAAPPKAEQPVKLVSLPKWPRSRGQWGTTIQSINLGRAWNDLLYWSTKEGASV